MSRPRLLDIGCKAGLASDGYAAAGFEVVGLDRDPQPNYPYGFIQADLRDVDPQWLAQNFAAAAGSPPCWQHSVLRHRTGREYEDFIPETRALFEASGLPYIIENVEGAPLKDPLVLCGTQFPARPGAKRLRVRRHRLFESNIVLSAPMPHPRGKHPLHYTLDKRKAHYGLLDEWTAFVSVNGGGNCSKAAALDAMGVRDRPLTKDELNQGVPPAYTEHLGRQLMAHLNGEVAAVAPSAVPLFQEVPVGPIVNVPFGAPPAWHRVVTTRAKLQCECAGQCGVAHKTGRCVVMHQGWHNKKTTVLVLAPKPPGLLLPLSKRAALSDAEQMAWCSKCLSAAEKLAALPT